MDESTEPRVGEIQVRVIPGPVRAGEVRRDKATESFSKRVGELGKSLGTIANDLRAQIDATLDEPEQSGWLLDEVELTFSIDLEAEAGVVVAKARSSAGFEASLTWKRR